jgi:hypothetical protein
MAAAHFGSGPPDGDWTIRTVTGQAATKAYRCPGCDHEIAPGTPHVVAWPPDDLEQRRHWHSACWRRALRHA